MRTHPDRLRQRVTEAVRAAGLAAIGLGCTCAPPSAAAAAAGAVAAGADGRGAWRAGGGRAAWAQPPHPLPAVGWCSGARSGPGAHVQVACRGRGARMRSLALHTGDCGGCRHTCMHRSQSGTAPRRRGNSGSGSGSALWAIRLPSAGGSGDGCSGDESLLGGAPPLLSMSSSGMYLSCLSQGAAALSLDDLGASSWPVNGGAGAAEGSLAAAFGLGGLRSDEVLPRTDQVQQQRSAGSAAAAQAPAVEAQPDGDAAPGALAAAADGVDGSSGAAGGGAAMVDAAVAATAADAKADCTGGGPPQDDAAVCGPSLSELISDVTTFLLESGAMHYEVAEVADAWQGAADALARKVDATTTDAPADGSSSEGDSRTSSSGRVTASVSLGYGLVARAAGAVAGDAAAGRVGGDWRANLQAMLEAGFSGSDLANMALRLPQLLDVDFRAGVVPVLELMRQALGLRPTEARRVLRRAPQALLPRPDGSTPLDTVEALQALGLKPKMVGLEVIRWPRLLSYPPASLLELAAWLGGAEAGMCASPADAPAVALAILRQAPWLAEHDLEAQLQPVAQYLQSELLIKDMQRVLRAYPQILCCSITGDLQPRVHFLMEEVGIGEEDVARVVQTFPLLFAVPLERMRGVYDLLSGELHIGKADITKIVRAFPSLLGLEPEKHIRAVVAYMRSLGIQNIGRFVSRLPPVLGYDVKNNLTPKMDYLVAKMGLSVYDVLTFPAYFSYPLESIIEPRTEFLKLRRRPISVVGLTMALTSGDADFAKKVAKVRPELYTSFKAAYIKNRKEVLEGRMSAEDVLELLGSKSLGSLGGLSTSSNVQEVTGAKQLADDEVRVKFGMDGTPPEEPP